MGDLRGLRAKVVGVFALTFGLPWSFTARFVGKASRIFQVDRASTGLGGHADSRAVKEENMPTSITLDDRLAQKVPPAARRGREPIRAGAYLPPVRMRLGGGAGVSLIERATRRSVATPAWAPQHRK